MKELLIVIARNLVDDKESVVVTETVKDDGAIILSLKVAESDMGKVIGKHGRIAKAIRSIVKVAAINENKKVYVEIV